MEKWSTLIKSEIIHLLLDTLPPTNILGMYQEIEITTNQTEEAHRVLRNKVTKCEEKGQVCILVPDILEWEKTGEIMILNDKQGPTHIPFQKGHQKNCIDMVMITPGLYKTLSDKYADEIKGTVRKF